MRKMKTFEMVLCALFAALTAIFSQISIPIGPVPINLAHVSVFVAAGLLGAKRAAFSQIIFAFLGAVGIPVFSGFAGGVGVILGPTGGFIIGYIGCAFATGIITDHFGRSVRILIPAMYAGWAVTYIFGISWFMTVTNSDLSAALSVCVFPFLAGDAPKTILSALLIKRLSPIVSTGLNRE